MLDPGKIHGLLDTLLIEDKIQEIEDGTFKIKLGRVTHRTTLPAQLWPALPAGDRFYSEQEIATLRTAVPMLQFARARLSEFTDHGPGHALRVKSFATQLSYIQGLSKVERHLLRAGALFHDIGNVVDRDRHNIISQETVVRLAADDQLPFTKKEAEIIGLLCRWHRGEYDPERVDKLRGETIRTGYLASILRVSDAMDIDHRRADYGEKFWKVLRFFFASQIHHWTSLEQILGVRIRCTPSVQLQVFTRERESENVQIDMLSGDLNSTSLDWKLMEIDVTSQMLASAPRMSQSHELRRALIVFPFEVHSLVMAGLSRKHLGLMGYSVELLCYPDTSNGPSWLWGETLIEMDLDGFDQLVILGDRPDPQVNSQLLELIAQWREDDLEVCILNRHETNWSRIPELLELGVEVILGGDWAYFWGDTISEADLQWGRVAALCTRDPTQSTVGVTEQERDVVQGLLSVVYRTMTCSEVDDTSGWAELAEPILSGVAEDDHAYFIEQTEEFLVDYSQAIEACRVDGQVVVFDQAPGEIPQAFYWLMEAAIEAQGRMPVRSIRYQTPYSVLTWPMGDEVELIAMSHWREEEAIPMRLYYPSKIGPAPQGNESTIRVRLAPEKARQVVAALIEACNQTDIT